MASGLQNPDNLARALREAGLASVAVTHPEYLVTMALVDHLSMRSASVENAVLRQMLDAEAGDDFARELAAALQQRFGDRVEYTREVHFAIGVKYR